MQYSKQSATRLLKQAQIKSNATRLLKQAYIKSSAVRLLKQTETQAPITIDKLKKIKELSDDKRYGAKANELRKLILSRPSEFYIDSEEGNILGLTHRPTNFKFHLPREIYPK